MIVGLKYSEFDTNTHIIVIYNNYYVILNNYFINNSNYRPNYLRY